MIIYAKRLLNTTIAMNIIIAPSCIPWLRHTSTETRVFNGLHGHGMSNKLPSGEISPSYCIRIEPKNLLQWSSTMACVENNVHILCP